MRAYQQSAHPPLETTALGIERLQVRNIYSTRNLNTLIYLVVNTRALP